MGGHLWGCPRGPGPLLLVAALACFTAVAVLAAPAADAGPPASPGAPPARPAVAQQLPVAPEPPPPSGTEAVSPGPPPGAPPAPFAAPPAEWLPCPPPAFATGLVLNLPAFELRYYVAGDLVAVYPVAIGRPEYPTPTGDFFIKRKLVNPTWYPPAGGDPVPPGPDNPLGTKWLGLSLEHYGMHGTNQPGSIGHAVSLGCIRLPESGIAELFAAVERGTPVSIVYRPVEVRRHRLTGERVVRVCPDVYGRGGASAEAVASALEGEGLAAPVAGGGMGSPGLLEAVLSRLGALPPPGPAPVEAWLGVPVRFNGRFLGLGRPWPGEPALVPLRSLTDALGVAVDWDPAAGQALVYGRPVPGMVVDGRTFVTPGVLPALGVAWAWDAASSVLDLSRVRVTVDSWPVEAQGLVVGGRVLVELWPVAQALGCLVEPGPDPATALVGAVPVALEVRDGCALVELEELALAAGVRAFWEPGVGLAALVSAAWEP